MINPLFFKFIQNPLKLLYRYLWQLLSVFYLLANPIAGYSTILTTAGNVTSTKPRLFLKDPFFIHSLVEKKQRLNQAGYFNKPLSFIPVNLKSFFPQPTLMLGVGLGVGKEISMKELSQIPYQLPNKLSSSILGTVAVSPKVELIGFINPWIILYGTFKSINLQKDLDKWAVIVSPSTQHNYYMGYGNYQAPFGWYETEHLMAPLTKQLGYISGHPHFSFGWKVVLSNTSELKLSHSLLPNSVKAENKSSIHTHNLQYYFYRAKYQLRIGGGYSNALLKPIESLPYLQKVILPEPLSYLNGYFNIERAPIKIKLEALKAIPDVFDSHFATLENKDFFSASRLTLLHSEISLHFSVYSLPTSIIVGGNYRSGAPDVSKGGYLSAFTSVIQGVAEPFSSNPDDYLSAFFGFKMNIAKYAKLGIGYEYRMFIRDCSLTQIGFINTIENDGLSKKEEGKKLLLKLEILV